MILDPASVLMTADGDFCSVNGKTVTIAFLAAACSLIHDLKSWCQKLLQRLPNSSSSLSLILLKCSFGKVEGRGICPTFEICCLGGLGVE
jgi:hypothetical protein